MTPVYTVHNKADRTSRYPIFARKMRHLFAVCCALANFKNLLFIQLCTRMLFAKGDALRMMPHPMTISDLPIFGANRQIMCRTARKALRLCAATIAIPFRGSFLLDHICRIVGVRAKEQMIGIAAQSNVAFVAHQQAIGDRPVSQFISIAMRAVRMFIDRELTVSPSIVYCSSPQPTGISLLNSRPKNVRGVFGDILTGHRKASLSDVLVGGVSSTTRPFYCLNYYTRIARLAQ